MQWGTVFMLMVLVGCGRNGGQDGGWSNELDNDADGDADDTGEADTTPAVEVTSIAQVVGEDGAQAGYALAAAGDVNGDGFDDVIFGAPGYDVEDLDHTVEAPPVGRAYLVYGPVSDGYELATAQTRMFGELAGDGTGTDVAAADMNGDGVMDAVVSAPFADMAGMRTGITYVLYGMGSGDMLLSGAQRVVGDVDGGYFGWRVAVGDVNNDDIPNLAVSAVRDGGGVVSVYASRSSGVGDRLTTIRSVDEDDLFGHDIAITDMDGDGVGELIASAPGYDGDGLERGALYVFSPGAGDFTADTAEVTLVGESGWMAGTGFAAGDLDQDGYGDMLLGAPGRNDGETDDVGSVMYLRGPLADMRTFVEEGAADAVYYGMGQGAMVGSSIAAAGDVNGDGKEDVVIGADRYGSTDVPGSGRAYLVLGPLRGSGQLDMRADSYTQGTGLAYDHVGKTVAGLGDIDGDGLDDWAAAAPYASIVGSLSGVTYVFSGSAEDGGALE